MVKKHLVFLSYASILMLACAMVFAEGRRERNQEAPQQAAVVASGAFKEAPLLTQMVSEGLIPPVAERLPESPMVIEPLESVGRYGGTMNIFGQSPWEAALMMGHQGPFLVDPQGTPGVPYVFESFEVSEDFKEWVFYLRKGLKWSDGEALTAWHLYDYWRYHRANQVLTPEMTPDQIVIEDNAVTFTDEPPWTKGRTVRKEIVDDYTVKFTSDVPYPFLINYMSASQFSVWSRFLPMHFLKQYHAEIVGEEAANAKAKAAGMNTWDQLYTAFGSTNHQSSMQVQRSYPPTLAPYVLVDRDENLITYERNPFYWAIDTAGNQLPYIDRIVFEQVNNREILDGKVISGEADWAGFDLKTESLPLYREYEESGNYTTSVWNCTFNTVIMRYNFNHQDPYLAELFLEKDFRMALQITVNRSRINDEVMFGLAKEYRMAPTPGNSFYDHEFEIRHTEFDPARAGNLLDGLNITDKDGDGWRDRPDGGALSLEVLVGDYETPKIPVMEIITNDWQAIGLNISFEVMDWPIRWPLVTANNYDMYTHHGAYNVPVTYGVNMFSLPGLESGQTFDTWYKTGGRAGIEPPPDIMELYDWYYKDLQSVSTEAEFNEISRKIWDNVIENVWTLDTLSEFPRPVIGKNDLMNQPTEEHGPLFWAWDFWWIHPYYPMQFYFADRPELARSESQLFDYYSPERMNADPVKYSIERGWM